ncbi:MAG: HAD-IC family P-type ATPase [Polyangiaceae bacterium]
MTDTRPSVMELLRAARDVFAPRRRRVWLGRHRAYAEFKQLSAEEETRLLERLTLLLQRTAWATSVKLDRSSRRAIFELSGAEVHELDVIRLLEEAERRIGVEAATFDEQARHPADDERERQLMVGLATDIAGFAVGSVLRATPLGPSSVLSTLGAVSSVLRGSPRLRQGLDDKYGVDRTDLGLGAAVAAANAFAQRPVSSLVDIVHKGTLMQESKSRRAVWDAREAEFHRQGVPDEHRADPRPAPLAAGPIEQYADRAWLVSLAGFGVSFLTTRNVQRAVAALFGGLPKPARLGRDVFAASLAQSLARRRVLVFDEDVLRRLDRVDCLVLAGSLITRDRFEIGEIITRQSITTAAARQRVVSLLDPENPLLVRRDQGWALAPARLLEAELDAELSEHAEALSRRGALALALSCDGKPQAVVELRIVPQTGVEELIGSAHEAEMRVVISADDEGVLSRFNVDDAVAGGELAVAGIRRLQREGRTVMFVGTGADARALAAADCGIGLMADGEPTPLGAHLICGRDLTDVRYVLSACVAARRVSKQSVNVALGAATFGTLISAGGVVPMTTRRVIAVVNTATLVAMAAGARASSTLSRRVLPPPRDRTPWHALEGQGVLERLGSSARGLTRGEARHRRDLAATRRSAPMELLDHFTDELFNPLAPLLAAGAGLSAVVGSLSDAAMVGGVVVLNAGIGGIQRFRTERAIRVLSRTAIRKALVRRGGELRRVAVGEVVRGDVVLLVAGDVVPADCRILEAESLEVDASSLTGESLPVPKNARPSFENEVADRASMLFEGTSIAAGRATAVVVATGEQTEARRSGSAMAVDPQDSGVERRLSALVDMTAPVAVTAAAGLVGVGLLRGRKVSDVIASGVSLAVASVPEGLPLIATAAQLSAAERLSKRGALVRNHRSVEALGRVDTVCVDKTGTVTQGRIELKSVSDGSAEEGVDQLGATRLRVLSAALRASPVPSGGMDAFDPTDAALLRATRRLLITESYGVEAWRRVSELPFEAARGYHAVLGSVEGASSLSVKGAPEVVLPQCSGWLRGGTRKPLDADTSGQLARAAGELAKRGLRVLAVAERSVGPEDRLDPHRPVGLSFMGFLAFSDPVRPTAAAALSRLAEIGVGTLMITGDHPSTAEAIASELGLLGEKEILTGSELARLSDDELDARISRVAVFARLTPSQKVRIVRALQRAGRCVAMVGDGANDAPAIRLANVGIAIGENSTAAARGAADVVLTDERIETLVDAIVEGRAVWKSVRDAVSILVGGNLGEIGFTLGAALVDGRPPLNARQLLLVNLLTDVGPAMAVALQPPARETLDALAREGPEASLSEPLRADVAARAVVTAAGAGAAWIGARIMGGRERASTVGLLSLVGTQMGQTLVAGGFSRPVVLTSAISMGALALMVQTPGVSHFFGCRPLGPVGWATALTASAGATVLAQKYPDAVETVARRLRLLEIVPAQAHDQLTAGTEVVP